MKPSDSIKLVSQLIDLPILDADGRWCGIVDDVELSGSAGKELSVKALLVGPGAYEGRMPSWLYRIAVAIAGDRLTRVPFDEVETIGSTVKLKCAAGSVGLHRVEDRVRAWIPRHGAM